MWLWAAGLRDSSLMHPGSDGTAVVASSDSLLCHKKKVDMVVTIKFLYEPLTKKNITI